MATKVIMPKAGMAMEEGTVVKWFKKEGESILKGEVLLEILTDKVNMEIEAEVSGVLLKILAKEGTKLPVLETIAFIGQEGEEISSEISEEKFSQNIEIHQKDKENNFEKSEVNLKTENINTDKVRATPAARFAARERGIEIGDVSGSGPGGRVQKRDVVDYRGNVSPLARRIASDKGLDLKNIKGTGYNGKIMSEDLKRDLFSLSKEDEIIPMSNMRDIISKRMSESYFTAPVFSLEMEVDMSKSLEFISDIRETVIEKSGTKPNVTDLIIFAATKALQKYPQINASLEGDNIRRYSYVSIALAVGMDEGLMVPVIKNTDTKSFSQIVYNRSDIVNRTNSGKLLPDEMSGSTFTISNLGMYGVKYFTSIINQPNSAILGVGAINDTVVARSGEIVIRPVMSLILTLDHRVIDGAKGAEFLRDLKESLENPIRMFV